MWMAILGCNPGVRRPLVGYGPWHEHPRPHPRLLRTLHGRLIIFLEECTDMPNPKSLQLSPRLGSGRIVLGK